MHGVQWSWNRHGQSILRSQLGCSCSFRQRLWYSVVVSTMCLLAESGCLGMVRETLWRVSAGLLKRLSVA